MIIILLPIYVRNTTENYKPSLTFAAKVVRHARGYEVINGSGVMIYDVQMPKGNLQYKLQN